jgi:hypothetical protein
MSSVAVGAIVFLCTFAGAMIGMYASSRLPDHHLSRFHRGYQIGHGLRRRVGHLDSLLADRRQRVRFVKMDLEGGEFHALLGTTSILHDRPLVIFENGLENAANLYGYASEDWFSLFERVDFAVFDLFGRPFCRDYWHAGGMPWYFIAAARGSPDERFVQRRAPNLVRRLYWKKTSRQWLRPRTRIRAAINAIRR